MTGPQEPALFRAAAVDSDRTLGRPTWLGHLSTGRGVFHREAAWAELYGAQPWTPDEITR